MNLISMKYSCIALLIIVVNCIADDNKWTDKPKVAKRIQTINQKLESFKQWVISARRSMETAINNNNCEKMSWGSELSMYKEDGCDQIEKSIYLYCNIFVGIVLIILIFYFHIVYPDKYLSEYKDNQLWHNVGFNTDTSFMI